MSWGWHGLLSFSDSKIEIHPVCSLPDFLWPPITGQSSLLLLPSLSWHQHAVIHLDTTPWWELNNLPCGMFKELHKNSNFATCNWRILLTTGVWLICTWLLVFWNLCYHTILWRQKNWSLFLCWRSFGPIATSSGTSVTFESTAPKPCWFCHQALMKEASLFYGGGILLHILSLFDYILSTFFSQALLLWMEWHQSWIYALSYYPSVLSFYEMAVVYYVNVAATLAPFFFVNISKVGWTESNRAMTLLHWSCHPYPVQLFTGRFGKPSIQQIVVGSCAVSTPPLYVVPSYPAVYKKGIYSCASSHGEETILFTPLWMGIWLSHGNTSFSNSIYHRSESFFPGSFSLSDSLYPVCVSLWVSMSRVMPCRSLYQSQ